MPSARKSIGQHCRLPDIERAFEKFFIPVSYTHLAGFAMAFGAGWESSPWLMLKMIPAVFLTGLHGLEGLALKRLLREGREVHPAFAAAPAAILLAFATIAWLALTKPF